MRMFRHLFMLYSRFPFRSVSFLFYCRLRCDCQMKSNSNSTENNQSHISKNRRAVCVFITHTLTEKQKNTSKHSTVYQTIPFECNKNEIANAYGAYNLCHLSLVYTQYFLSIYDSLRYKIESNKRSGKQQFFDFG